MYVIYVQQFAVFIPYATKKKNLLQSCERSRSYGSGYKRAYCRAGVCLRVMFGSRSSGLVRTGFCRFKARISEVS